MLRRLTHRFVQYLPETLEPGILYISLEYVTASHLCCCGCGKEVVTPLSPVSWRLTFDGETVSLWPSIGNWNLPCRSHYIIDGGRVVVARAWSDDQIAAESQRNLDAKASHYNSLNEIFAEESNAAPNISAPERMGWFRKIIHRLFGANL